MNDAETMSVTVPVGEKGGWKIVRSTVEKDDPYEMIDLWKYGRHVPAGMYTRLLHNGHVVMSDTPDEMRDHQEFVRRAKGNVLIAGLGLGMAVQACCLKSQVDRVIVVEISSEVIELVGPHYMERFGDKLKIVNADIFKYTPPRGMHFDVAWYDIWSEICGDNLKSMEKLHSRFESRVTWQDSWMRGYLMRLQRRGR